MNTVGKRSYQSVALSALLLSLAAGPVRGEEPGLRVAPGFRVTLYADQDIANDIFAMTLDSQGRVVVTSQGYIKVLHDTKGTGKADRATLWPLGRCSPTGASSRKTRPTSTVTCKP